jgi:hypothetical protein
MKHIMLLLMKLRDQLSISEILIEIESILSFGTYQESCPLGVLELRTSMQLTSI